MQAEQLDQHLWRLQLPAETLPPYDHTNSFVITNDTGEALLVDIGSDEGAMQVTAWLKARALHLTGILLTHTHIDHIAGLRMLLEHNPNLPIHLHAAEVDRLDAQLPLTYHKVVLADDDVLEHNEATIHCLYTPGHSAGHLSFVVQGDTTSILAGDMVTGDGAIWVGTPEGDLSAYLASLARLETVDADVLAPSHGAVSLQPHELLEKATTHKHNREQQIIDALKKPQSLDALTSKLYSDVTGVVYDFAQRSLHAHLVKLEHDGRIRQDDKLYVLT
jgi:glyoxylase-like metal-dependent hydrolase (beta-lactamase superfamily II)